MAYTGTTATTSRPAKYRFGDSCSNERYRMNDNSTGRSTKLVATLVSLAIRHAVASVATIVAACAVWTVVYAALLLWAIVANDGLGGPLAYPGGLLLVAVAAGVGCLLLFFPATVSAELICRNRALPILMQIPVSVAALAALCALAGVILRASAAVLPFGASVSGFVLWLFMLSLLPIGFYWWIAESAPLVRSAIRMLRTSLAADS
jgi:hypothetical protein